MRPRETILQEISKINAGKMSLVLKSEDMSSIPGDEKMRKGIIMQVVP